MTTEGTAVVSGGHSFNTEVAEHVGTGKLNWVDTFVLTYTTLPLSIRVT